MSNKQQMNYKAMVITGLVSLLVAVGGNLLVNKLTEERLALEYELSASEIFNSSSGSIRIANVIVKNQGSKSVDDITLSINLPDGAIEEYKLNGLPPNSYSMDSKDKSITLTTKYLNPNEEFNLQLFLKNPNKSEFYPLIDLRGRGVLGKQAVKEKKKTYLESILTVVAALITAFGLISLRGVKSKVLGVNLYSDTDLGDQHRVDEQRDAVAYILGINSLGDYSGEIRMFPRKISYWSICDYLTQKWIDSGDKDLCSLGAKALQDLLAYAPMADDSVLLIKSNIAKLYSHAKLDGQAKEIIDEIENKGGGVIKARISTFQADEPA